MAFIIISIYGSIARCEKNRRRKTVLLPRWPNEKQEGGGGGGKGGGGVHDQNKCQRPRDRLRGVTWRYVGRSHVSPEGSDLPSRRSFRARLIETWGQGHGWKTLPLLSLTYANSLRDFGNRGTTSATIAPLSSCYEFSWGETRDFLNKIFFSILKRDSISKLIMYRSF